MSDRVAGGVPWKKFGLVFAGIAVVGVWFGFGTAAALREDEDRREDGYRERCAEVPEALEAVVAAGLVDLDGRHLRASGLTRAVEGELDGSWFVSLELRPTTSHAGRRVTSPPSSCPTKVACPPRPGSSPSAPTPSSSRRGRQPPTACTSATTAASSLPLLRQGRRPAED